MNLTATQAETEAFERRIRELIAEGYSVRFAVYQAYREHPVMQVMHREALAGIRAEAARGYGEPLPQGIAARLFTQAWAPDGLTLSARTTRGSILVREMVARTLEEQIAKGASCRAASLAIFDGYKQGGVIPVQDIPKYLQETIVAARHAGIPRDELMKALKPIRRQIEKGTTAGMRAAYTQLVDALDDQNEKALNKAIYTATQERTRYFADRIARTEMARAYQDGFLLRWDNNDDCVAYQWKLSGRHPRYDICDLYANANLYGMGAGVFPKDKVPLLPAHPHCMCFLKPVIRGMLDNETPIDRVEEGGREYLDSVSLHHRQMLLGIHGEKDVRDGKLSWTAKARGYGGKKVESRLSSTGGRGDIIIQSGALDPGSDRAYDHAVRYYESVRHMTTDCKRIAANTGFREQDIRIIKNHVFIEEHDLYDGKMRFIPDYEMAQSWQRLIDGQNIKERDIVLLNHEFLEHTLMTQGLSTREAHKQAQNVYNYAVMVRRG